MTLKKSEEISCGLEIGYDICSTQSWLFTYAWEKGFDIEDFIRQYMCSDFCKRHMDTEYSVYQLMDAPFLLSYVLDEITPKKSEKHYEEDVIEWIGWTYRYLVLRLERSSKEIYEVLSFETMLNYAASMRWENEEDFINTVKDKFANEGEHKTTEKPICAVSYDPEVEHDICDTQGWLFQYASEKGFDMEDFIRQYMCSDFCRKNMDAEYSHYKFMTAPRLLAYVLSEVTPKKSEKREDDDVIEWIGWTYRYLERKLQVSSKEIYEVLPFGTMLPYASSRKWKDADDFVSHVKDKFQKKERDAAASG